MGVLTRRVDFRFFCELVEVFDPVFNSSLVLGRLKTGVGCLIFSLGESNPGAVRVRHNPDVIRSNTAIFMGSTEGGPCIISRNMTMERGPPARFNPYP